MPIPQKIQRRVAHIDVLLDHAFNQSVDRWRHAPDAELRWSDVNTQYQPMLIGEQDALAVDGDSNALLSAPDGGVLHVNGDVNADMDAGGLNEIVITGNVSTESTIRSNGFLHMYVGGSMLGRIESTDTSKIWVDGDFPGALLTGNPVTHLYVHGDFNGEISPTDEAALLFLCIDGFASDDSISSIASIGYTVFNATIGTSDVDAGIYPDGPGCRLTDDGNSFSRWCVLSRHQ